MLKCSCGGKIFSIGTNRFVCEQCKKEYKKVKNGRIMVFDDLEEI